MRFGRWLGFARYISSVREVRFGCLVFRDFAYNRAPRNFVSIMAKKLFVKTHGCQMNEYDSARMYDVLRESQGYERAETEDDADVLLLNTCSIREKAQEKVFHQLGRWQKLKTARPDLVIGVGGCVASQEGDAIMRRAPVVDMVFGPQTIHRLPQMLDSRVQQLVPVVDITFPEVEKFDRLPEPQMDGPAAFVSIMEGCSKYCSFCVVPYTRGEEVSRSVESVLQEVRGLVAQGVREIHLLGQNVNSYLGEIDGDQADLAELIYYVADIDGVERIRFTTSHPMDFSDNLLEVYRDVPQLVDHLHLPVQAGSDRILEAMKRGHTAEQYVQKIDALREIRPNISLSSDFIVGFPGETADDFAATMALIERVGFDVSFSFIYSARPGTPAAALVDETPDHEKKARLQQLQAKLRSQAEAIAAGMVGTRQRLLVTGFAKKDATGKQLAGRTENNRVVNFAGPAALVGDFCSVEITEALPNSMRGTLVAD